MTESERQAEIAWYNLQRHLVDTGQDPITADDQLTDSEDYEDA